MTDTSWPEIWGGFECTVARVRDGFRDQLAETGHRERLDDLDRIHALGIRTVRYPALWEQIAPKHPDLCDWNWHDSRFAHLRRLGMRPIVGLVHHGSGPHYTNLLDPDFPFLLARHARRVAERYPWLDAFTPVNEPLTTARFSALYGHWHPHGTDNGVFLRAIVNQCKASLLAMRAIREVVPGAQLVSTEDIGKTFSTPELAHQALYENDRRWLSLDLLCGRLDKDHPWRGYLLAHGVSEADLDLLCEGDGAPDVIGVNHYLTSERYLDGNWSAYPDHFLGGNGTDVYADVEAVRMDVPPQELGPKARLLDVIERYGRPVAVSEAHHGCTRDEQLRWLAQVWNAAAELKAEGRDVRAVTIWAMLGAIDWNSLLTRSIGHYEPGAFDIRCPRPRLTALGRATRSLAETGTFTHPALGDGWWRREERFYAPRLHPPAPAPGEERPPLLITGASGTLGRAFARICAWRGLRHLVLDRRALDVADPEAVSQAVDHVQPWAVVNAAGYVRVAQAQREQDLCFRANAAGSANLARTCAARDIPLLTFSSDLVFDGTLGRAYVESDAPAPTGVYGRSKAEAERAVLETHPDALVIRTSSFFGPWDEANFALSVLRAASAGRPVSATSDVVSPTYVPDLVHAALDLLIDAESGIWHLANRGAMSWADFARRIAQAAGLPAPRIIDARAADAPRNTALSSEKSWIMPPLDGAIERFVRDCALDWRAQEKLLAAE